MVSSSSNPVHQAVDVELKREQQAASQSVSLEAGESNGDLSIVVCPSLRCTLHSSSPPDSTFSAYVVHFLQAGPDRSNAVKKIGPSAHPSNSSRQTAQIVGGRTRTSFADKVVWPPAGCISRPLPRGGHLQRFDVAMIFFVRAAAAASATSTEA